MDPAGLPAGWTVWNVEPEGRAIVVFRRDVFDESPLPTSCLPTLTVSQRPPVRRRPGRESYDGRWYVALYLEPDVRVTDCDTAHETRGAAIEAAVEVATRFVDGEIQPRAAYQMPNEPYLDVLEPLLGESADGREV